MEVSEQVSDSRRFNARFSSSSASNSASGGHAAIVTPNALSSAVEPMFASRDSEIPKPNANHAVH